MRVVIIGAGAVGVVLGDSLERQKHEVVYLVRPGVKKSWRGLFLEDAATGEVRRRDAPNVAEIGAQLPPFENALICVRGDQLAGGLETLAQHLRSDAAVGVASARLDEIEQARAAWTGGPVFSIWPHFMAWSDEPYSWRWFKPPLLKTLVSGEGDAEAQAAADRFAAALTAAGVPAASVPSARRATLPLLSSGMALLAGWELSNWDAKKLANSDELRGLTAGAMREAAQAVKGEGDSPFTRLLAVMPPMALSLLIRALPVAARGRMLEMWSHHGPKIAGQTRSVIDEVLDRAQSHGVAVPRLRELRERLGTAPAAK